MPELNDEIVESSPTLEGAIASSPEVKEEASDIVEQVETETSTPQQEETQPQETPFHEHPRWKEVIDERNFWRDKAMRDQQQPQQPQQPERDPYEGFTPEQKVFWQEVDKRASIQAQKMVGQLNPSIEAARMELAQMKVMQFRQAHPDIKPNSPDEMEIAQRIQMGYTPDDAYWSVMGPRGQQVVKQNVVKQVKQQIHAKHRANADSTSGVSQSARNDKPMTFEEELELNLSRAARGEL